jgi:hypothetical protein
MPSTPGRRFRDRGFKRRVIRLRAVLPLFRISDKIFVFVVVDDRVDDVEIGVGMRHQIRPPDFGRWVGVNGDSLRQIK